MITRSLAPGELIREPGFYAIPLSVHHGPPCDGVSVTSGVLRRMDSDTPAEVWAFHKLNPDRWVRKETDALRLGVAMALYVEGGPHRVLEKFKVHPEDKPRKPTALQRKAVARAAQADKLIKLIYATAGLVEPEGVTHG